MIAVDDRERIDPARDRGIGRAAFGGDDVAAVDAEQRGDDLQVVLHAVMDFANKSPLTFQRIAHFALARLDSLDRPGEGLTQAFDLDRRTNAARQDKSTRRRIIGRDRPLEPAQGPDQQPRDEQPADHRGDHPHRQRQQQQQPVAGAETIRRDRHADRQLAASHVVGAGANPAGRAARTPDHCGFADPVIKLERKDVGRDIARCGGEFGKRQAVGRHAAVEPDADEHCIACRIEPQRDPARLGKAPTCGRQEIGGDAMFAAIGTLDREVARDSGRDGERATGFLAVLGVGRCNGGGGGDPERQRVAGDEAFDRARSGLVLFLGALVEQRVGVIDAAVRRPHHRHPDRQQRQRHDQQ